MEFVGRCGGVREEEDGEEGREEEEEMGGEEMVECGCGMKWMGEEEEEVNLVLERR